MVELTPDALAAARRLRDANPEYAGLALRVYLAGKGCDGFNYGVSFDRPGIDDVTHAMNGLRVIIDRPSLPILMGSTLDWRESDVGAGFVVNNPRHELFRGKFFRDTNWRSRLYAAPPPRPAESHVIASRQLPGGVLALRVSRDGVSFRPGQHVLLGVNGDDRRREYSIASSTNDPHLDFLVRVIPGGLSESLSKLDPGDRLTLGPPSGNFALGDTNGASRHVFVVTGTAIAPAMCLARSIPDLDFQVVHGTRSTADDYDLVGIPTERYTRCVSADAGGDFQGRVTDLARQGGVPVGDWYYLCGQKPMIQDVKAALIKHGAHRSRIKVLR